MCTSTHPCRRRDRARPATLRPRHMPRQSLDRARGPRPGTRGAGSARARAAPRIVVSSVTARTEAPPGNEKERRAGSLRDAGLCDGRASAANGPHRLIMDTPDSQAQVNEHDPRSAPFRETAMQRSLARKNGKKSRPGVHFGRALKHWCDCAQRSREARAWPDGLDSLRLALGPPVVTRG